MRLLKRIQLKKIKRNRWACKNGRSETAAYLVAVGADAALRSSDDSTAFDWAVLSGHERTMELLFRVPGLVDVAARNKYGSRRRRTRPLFLSFFFRLIFPFFTSILRLRPLAGCAAVQWAAAAGNVVTCKWLRARGFQLGHVNAANHGAVNKAAWHGHLPLLEWLLVAPDGPRLRSQLTLLDHDGRDVAALAELNAQFEAARWLRKEAAREPISVTSGSTTHPAYI